MYWAQKKAMLALGMVLTCRGMPMLFQGQELLTFTAFEFPIPSTLDWSRASAQAGLRQETADMIALRVSKNAATDGLLYRGHATVLAASHSEGVGVIQRSPSVTAGAARARGNVLVVYHFQKTTIPAFRITGISNPGTYRVLFNGDRKQYSTLYDDTCVGTDLVVVDAHGTCSVCIPPMAMLVLAQE